MPKRLDQTADEEALAKLGDAIRLKRNSIPMSQEALAHAAQINRTHMGEVERGKRNVSFLALLRIARAMNSTPSQIMEAIGL